MRGLTRIINGDAWKRRSTSGKQFGVPDVSVDVSLGIRTLELKDEILDKGVGLASKSTSNTATASMRKIPNPTTISPSRRI